MALSLIFMGTPDFSVPVLQALHAAGHEIVACYTQPPRPAGRRGLELKASPVQEAAERLSIPVLHPVNFKLEDDRKVFAAFNADAAVVVAYGLLLPAAILEATRLGCYNGHASLLPRWRGAAPIQRAIMAGDRQTGVMIMKMDEGLDTGPVAMTASVPIHLHTTAGQLHDELAALTADQMVRAMEKLEAGTIELTPQDEDGVTYAAKISKDESRIDWTRPSDEVHRQIMGLSPFPGAWCEMELGGKAHRVKLLLSAQQQQNGDAGTVLDDQLTIACGSGSVRLVKLQKAGSKAMDAQEFLRGNSVTAGMRLV